MRTFIGEVLRMPGHDTRLGNRHANREPAVYGCAYKDRWTSTVPSVFRAVEALTQKRAYRSTGTPSHDIQTLTDSQSSRYSLLAFESHQTIRTDAPLADWGHATRGNPLF